MTNLSLLLSENSRARAGAKAQIHWEFPSAASEALRNAGRTSAAGRAFSARSGPSCVAWDGVAVAASDGRSQPRLRERTIRMQRARVLAVLGAMLVAPALLLAQKVTYDFDKNEDFTKFK